MNELLYFMFVHFQPLTEEYLAGLDEIFPIHLSAKKGGTSKKIISFGPLILKLEAITKALYY